MQPFVDKSAIRRTVTLTSDDDPVDVTK